MKRRDIPWFQRTNFYLGALLFFGAYAALLLPEKGFPSTIWAGVSVILFFLLILITVSVLLIDRFRPEWIKTVAVLSLLLTFGLLFYLYSGADWGLFTKQFFNLQKMEGRYHIFIQPFFVVLRIALLSFVFAPLIGLFLAIFRTFNNPFLNVFIAAYINFFRSIPSIALIVLVYFALPYVGIELQSTVAVIVALSLFFGAYAAEIFRAGIEAIHHTQIEAAYALGLTPMKTMRLVILPQAVRIVIPPLTSLMVGILKTTSIAYVAGVPELIARARQMQSIMSSATPLIIVSGIYLSLVLPLVLLSSYLEKRSKRWSRKANI